MQYRRKILHCLIRSTFLCGDKKNKTNRNQVDLFLLVNGYFNKTLNFMQLLSIKANEKDLSMSLYLINGGYSIANSLQNNDVSNTSDYAVDSICIGNRSVRETIRD